MIRLILALGAIALVVIVASLPGLELAAAGEPRKVGNSGIKRKDRETITDFRKIWHGRRDGVFANRYLGVSTLQNPNDAWITFEILYEVKPDLVVEAGTYHGGSALLWATVLQQIKPEARVVTIDIEDQREKGAIEHPLAKRRVDFLLGSSTAPEIVADVKRRARDKRVVVILDSLHTAEHVLEELRAYWPLVGVGSYLIVQDTAVGPLKAVNEFLAENDRFVIDKDRERLWITNNVNGFLKRVK